ncbi:hypothetical protein CAC42_4105 [Sphaceloma murrayae]|uniref:DyP dimeric alpha+beta barrel domain-containing protein n=1 Tax=Sphaceloma murrayae TaxID=2082308 RepID=A0A2K1QLF8_9PEZI|nr:hypothetical protein CAC42_4105 [Sphaceloma murrayae]
MAATFDLNNIQGDVFPSLPKKTQTFFFFKIVSDIDRFKQDVGRLVPHIATGTKVQNDRSKISEVKRSGNGGLLTVSGVNIAFSKEGLLKLGLNQNNGDKLGDSFFDNGMLSDAQTLGDKGTRKADGSFVPAWEPAFASQDIDGVILVAGDCRSTVAQAITDVKSLFGFDQSPSVSEVLTIVGDVRPGAQDGHEHFGFEDGISQPAIDGVDAFINPGQVTVPQGVVFCGRDGDTLARPSWALDGSFLCFRKLAQLVPEFDNFLAQNTSIITAGNNTLPQDQAKELLGARLVGRWKSGAPIELAPTADDPDLAQDKARNNNFDFSGDAGKVCPFAAHIRKTNPRSDFATAGLSDPTALTNHLFPRRGIPYGPEVTAAEADGHRTTEDRGLLFNPNPGFDPIIGQNADDSDRTMTGAAVGDVGSSLNLGPFEWVVSKGGAYFFTPSIPALKEKFSTGWA